MARHLDMEAQWYSGHFGLTDEQVKLSREKARQLWIAADEADQRAREYRRQVPSGTNELGHPRDHRHDGGTQRNYQPNGESL
jgi:hypothetical protein